MDPLLLNLILLAPLILGMAFSQLLRLNLRAHQGVYLIFVVANVVIGYFFLEGMWLPQVIIGAVGIVLAVVATGIFGTRVRPADYAFGQAGVGLFPWTLWGFTAGLYYGVVLILFVIVIALRPKFKNPLRRNR